MKRALLSMAATTGAFAPFRAAHRRQALIVTYHRFAAAPGVPDATPGSALEAQLAYLTKHYAVVPLAWLADRLARGGRSARPLAAITIDDGYADVHKVALPVLRRFGVPATVFVVTGFLDDDCWIWTDKTRYLTAVAPAANARVMLEGAAVPCALDTAAARRATAARINRLLKTWPDERKETALAQLSQQLGVALPSRAPSGMRPLTWPQARALAAAGVDIASHTVTHPVLTQVGPERLMRELAGSRTRLRDELAAPADIFCYPDGALSPAVRAAVVEAGYRAAVTTVHGFNDARTDPFALRRIHTESDLPHFVQSTSGFESFKTRLRAVRPRGWSRAAAPEPSLPA